jgi:hypothetical protein
LADAPNVSGTFRYASAIYGLSGTIRFEQDGSRVRVTDTTYDRGNDRALAGEAELLGNRLDIQLTPRNGDTNYSADVRFLFSASGSEFCLLGFEDTNGDVGGEGSYFGERL